VLVIGFEDEDRFTAREQDFVPGEAEFGRVERRTLRDQGTSIGEGTVRLQGSPGRTDG
jgi:hypothetical protein